MAGGRRRAERDGREGAGRRIASRNRVRVFALSALVSVFCLIPSVFPLRTIVFLSAQAARPLPEEKAFFDAAQQNLSRSQGEQFRFAYKERRTELHMNPFGRLGTGGTLAYEVIPENDGAIILRRLIERDGKPVADAPVERSERRARGNRPARRSSVDDTANVLSFAMERREHLQGRDTIVVRFEPRPNARAETREGRLARAFTGRIWIDEVAREVIRVEATAVDDISYGLGLVARLNKGTTVSLKREHVDGSVWLPTSIRFMGHGRAMIFRRLNVDHVIEWYDYRRVTG